jgi:hypothetical protein
MLIESSELLSKTDDLFGAPPRARADKESMAGKGEQRSMSWVDDGSNSSSFNPSLEGLSHYRQSLSSILAATPKEKGAPKPRAGVKTEANDAVKPVVTSRPKKQPANTNQSEKPKPKPATKSKPKQAATTELVQKPRKPIDTPRVTVTRTQVIADYAKMPCLRVKAGQLVDADRARKNRHLISASEEHSVSRKGTLIGVKMHSTR